MQDVRQRVAGSEFCPDAKAASNQIHLKCCRRAAVGRRKGPKVEQVNEHAAKPGREPLTAAEAAGFNRFRTKETPWLTMRT